MNLHSGLEKSSAMPLNPDQEHGVRNAIQVIESAYRVLLKNPDISLQDYYQMRADQFRMIAKNMEPITKPKCLLILAEAYEFMAKNAPVHLISLPAILGTEDC